MPNKSKKQIPSKVGYFQYFNIGKNIKCRRIVQEISFGQSKAKQGKHTETLNVTIFLCLLWTHIDTWSGGLRIVD